MNLDLFIVVEDGKESSRLIRRKIDALLWGRRFPVDLVVRKEKEIKRNFRAKNPFYIHHTFKDGKYSMKRNAEEIKLVKDWLKFAKGPSFSGLSPKPFTIAVKHRSGFIEMMPLQYYFQQFSKIKRIIVNIIDKSIARITNNRDLIQ